jgi:lantibiotic leader peptide-processing serine protease
MHGRLIAALLAIGVLLAAAPLSGVATADAGMTRYNVVLAGTATEDGFALAGTKQAVLTLVTAAGGSVVHDLSGQIGVLTVDSPNALFDDVLRTSPLVEEVGEDFKWKAFDSLDEARANGTLTVLEDTNSVPGGGPAPHADALEPFQWSMQQIRAPQAHAIQAGSPLVEVGILDSGVDSTHVDLSANVDCVKARDFVPLGPGIAVGGPCNDNQFHGTHVAGIVAGAINGVGIVGVAPRVKLVPVKVCDALGYCYSSSTAAGITYAGDAKLEVINMSFFVDDDQFLQSTEFKCMSDPVQRAFRKANERAIAYARNQGVVPVAALGNSDNDLAHPPEPYENECDVVPAETQGVIGTMSLGPGSEKATYSNYGFGMTDVAAPGGNGASQYPAFPGPCGAQVLSSFPGNLYVCIQGTSMASPHAAGVAALIVSQYGRLGADNDMKLPPQTVESYLQGTTVDIGLPGYDECFGNGRIDAMRAVTHDTSPAYDAAAPACPEYTE